MRRPSIDPSDEQQCYESALRSLRARFHGEAELRKKLRGKGFRDDAIDSAIRRLAAERWIDDRRFATAFAAERLRKRLGPDRIVQELRARGIAPAVAAEATREAAMDDDVDANLAALCARKIAVVVDRRGSEALSDEGTRNKLIGFLLKQGYEYGAASSAVDSQLSRARDSMKD